MGNCSTKDVAWEVEANKRIDDTIKHDMRSGGHEIKLLLLGAGESGKSTIFKQIKIIHASGFSAEERKRFVTMIRTHVIENLTDLMHGVEMLNTADSSLFVENGNKLISRLENEGLRDDLVPQILQLWTSKPAKTAFSQRHLFQLADSAAYFFENLERVAHPTFSPTTEDILRCRVRTTGLVEMHFVVNDVSFRLLDVGGQRNERRKWIHCFEGVQAVIFVAAISEYDQVLFEDESSNRLQEALKLFKEICNTRFFLQTTVILFLNKRDLFEEKIKRVDLKTCFPEYDGGLDEKAGMEFLKCRFLAESVSTHQEVFVHATCATDTSNIKFVFDVVRDSILVDNISSSGFV